MSTKCALCELSLPKQPIREEEHAFCCAGCLTVFRILRGQVAEGTFRHHPLFQQALDAGVISHPEIERVEKPKAEEVIKLHLEIGEMWCPSCAEAIRLILLRHKGILSCLVDYTTDFAVIEFNPRLISKEAIEMKIKRMGYAPQPLLADTKSRYGWIRFALVAFCALNLMMFAYPLYVGGAKEGYDQTFGWLSFALSVPLITFGAWPIWRRFWTRLRTALFGMETLILLGMSTAFGYSTYQLLHHHPHQIYFDTMGMILTFVLLGKLLEKRAKFSAKSTLMRVMRTLPRRGYVEQPDGSYAYQPLKEIKAGDRLLARRGEKIVLDGVVESGEAWVDESVMTGEAMPRLKRPLSPLVGGSIVHSGQVSYTASAAAEESLLAKITQLVESQLGKRRPLSNLIDTVTRWFIPAVILLALFSGSFLTALSVLLIACPCALGMAIPLVEARLIHQFADRGALVRNRAALTHLANHPLFVFDKTGTLTHGKFRLLTDLSMLSSEEAAILKSLASHSTHPISVAIVQALPGPLAELSAIEEIVGQGVEGCYQNRHYRLGSPTFLGKPAQQLSTCVYFNDHLVELGDTLRSNLPQVDGIILSGDTPALVDSLARRCNFQWGKGGCSPQQKQEEILRLKSYDRPVVMVGDGINDAPALAAADVGISVSTATDLSNQVADILLTTDHLDRLPQLAHLARHSQRLIYQNLFWAFGYNVIGIGLAFTGHLTPLMAATAMILSSLCVTLNSLRPQSLPRPGYEISVTDTEFS